MKSVLKWILVVGAILSGLLLMGLLFLNGMWMSFGRGGMMYGGRHATFGVWPSYGGLVWGIIFSLLVIGGLFLTIRSKPKTELASGSPSDDPWKICPACGIDLEPAWKHCPSCGFDLLQE
jgi:hypothetical protein